MPDPDVLLRMQSDWNQRAKEDAHYYVAFGRRQQDSEEFFASAADVVRLVSAELNRLPPGKPRRALEIGCGPGRLMRPISERFDEIYGVDVSEEMIHRATQNLTGRPNAHARHTTGADLAPFAGDFFDLVYSYAVFQHIPSRDVVFEYLVEARRVLRTGGILRCQFNGLPPAANAYDTWSGVRLSAGELADFARAHDFQLLAMEGVDTQYLWTTWRKRAEGWSGSVLRNAGRGSARIRSMGSAETGEPVVPARGKFAAAAIMIEDFPEDGDLNSLEVRIGGQLGRLSYIGPPARDGFTQLNVALPVSIRTGLLPVEVFWLGHALAARSWMRIVPAGPSIPRVCSVSDGVNLLSGTRIESGIVKVVLEDLYNLERVSAVVDDTPVSSFETFCTDPLTGRSEVNVALPPGLEAGDHRLALWLGKRILPSISFTLAN